MSWQYSLATSYSRIGGALEAKGRLAAALQAHSKSKVIMERLAAQDPNNANWQYSLAGAYGRIGGVLEHQGNLASALEEFHRSLIIREWLVAQNPENARWLDGLAISYNRIGHALESQGNLAGALGEFRKALSIRERLVAQAPENARWQRGLGVSRTYMANLQLKAGQFHLANATLSQAASNFHNLISVDDPGTLIDCACEIALRAEIEKHLNDDKALAHSLSELLDLDLQVKGVSGAFHKRLLPKILEQMGNALAHSETERKLLLIIRALRLSAAAPHLDMTFWKQAAKEMRFSLSSEHEFYEELKTHVGA